MRPQRETKNEPNPMPSPPEPVLRQTILRKARALREEHWDKGEINLTTLAEDVAWGLGHDEWLDDSTHLLWDVVIDAAQEIGGLR